MSQGADDCPVQVSERELNRADQFLLLASSGLWHAMTSQQAVDHVRRMIVEWPSRLDDVAVKAIAGRRLYMPALARHLTSEVSTMTQ